MDEPSSLCCEKVFDSSELGECLPSEPVFVPRDNEKNENAEEDDGVLLVIVLNDKGDFLSVLDARDLSELARACIPAQVKASLTFHGFFADRRKYNLLN